MTQIVELQAEMARVRLAPALGGRLTSVCLAGADGKPVPCLHPYPEFETTLLPWAKGGLYPLIPYSGRIAEACLCHEGRVMALAPHPGGEPHTVHGISQQRAWALTRQTPTEATLCYRHQPDIHWPWHFEAVLEVKVEPRRLCLEMGLANLDSSSMPAGIGAHPYPPYQRGDTLSYVAGPEWPFDKDFLALMPAPGNVGPRQVSEARFQAGEVTLFHGRWNGEACLRRAHGELIRIRADAALAHLVIHRPASSPYLCIEPVSHVGDGFNLQARGVEGTGTRILAPGQALRGHVEILTY
jgi:aldose 1-epimerase